MSSVISPNFVDPTWNQPLDESDLVRIACWRAETQPDDIGYTFLVDGELEEQHLSYGELDAKARAIAAALRKTAAVGDRALLLYEPGLDYIAAFYGCLYAGIVAVPAYPPDIRRIDRTLPRLKAIMHDANAHMLMCTSNIAHLVEMLNENNTLLTTDNLSLKPGNSWKALPVESDRLAYLQYTSGSTGTPKGVMISHRNMIYNVACTAREMEEITGVTWLPTYHDFGLIAAVVLPMYAGRHTISMSPLAFMQRPLRWLEAITRFRGTITGAPNFSYDLCVRKSRPEDRRDLDLSSLTIAMNGAEPVRKETMDRFIEAFEPHGFRRDAFMACYGLAEATLGVSSGVWPAYPRIKRFKADALEQHRAIETNNGVPSRTIVSCGLPIEQTEVSIVDPETEQELSENSVGEIWVRGPGVAGGYWQRPSATAETFEAYTKDTGKGPYLRTGDLGFMHEGELYITGRSKDLIIVGGRNHYPQDIEFTVQRAHKNLKPECGAAFAIEEDGQERLVVVQEILRSQKCDLEEVVGAIREAITLTHEIPVHAIVLIKPGRIHKTSSGKIQRRACRQAFQEGRLSVVHMWQAGGVGERRAESIVAPRTETEAKLADLYCEVLGLEEVSIHENFFDLGGHSLLATQLATRIRSDFLVDLPLRNLFASPTVAELAVELEEACRTRSLDEEGQIRPRSSDEPLVASHGQQRLWFMHQLAPHLPLFNLCLAVRIRSPLNESYLQEAWSDIAARHDSLRTTFWEIDGRPVPRVAKEQTFPLQQYDLGSLAPAAREEELARISRAEAARHYDLEKGPLARLTLIRCDDSDQVLLISMHHIISDGWSMSLLVQELFTAYQARSEGRGFSLAGADLQYSDYAAWQHEQLHQSAGDDPLKLQLDYWKQQLADAPACLALPTDRPRPAAPSFQGAVRRFELSPEQTAGIEQLSKAAGATPFMTLLAALQCVLGRFSGQTDICIGTALANRTRPELEGLIGFFVNSVVMRGDLSGNPTFRELLSRTRETTLAAYDHADVPFERVVDALCRQRDTSHAPLFQTALVLQNQPWQSPAEEFQLCEVHNGTSKYDLTWSLWKEGGRLVGSVEYSTDLFDASTVDRFIGSFHNLIEAATTNPDRSIERLPLLTDSQREKLIAAWNPPAVPYADQSCLHELFEDQAARNEHAIALTFGEQQVSYGELNRRANQLAHYLRERGVGPDSLVGISLPRSVDMIVAVLGVLKAGGAYLPLDPHYPQSRLAQMLADAGPAVIVTSAEVLADLPACGASLVVLDRDQQAIAATSEENPAAGAKPGNLAYIIYTSGSTGAPKGVMIEHASACNMVQWYQDCIGVRSDSRLLQFASLSFDASAGEIFPALCHGATLVLPPDEKPIAGPEFIEFMQQQQVSLAQLPPSFLALLPESSLPHLTTLLVAGDVCTARLASRWAGNRRMINGYGPTEGTVGATWSLCRPNEVPNIGRPFSNVRIYLLDPQGQPVPAGAPGEIYIGGAGVARGYLNQPELTAQRFLSDPFLSVPGGRMYRTGDLARQNRDGALEYLGRCDQQVKVRGFRIEPSEIETVLLSQPGVRQAVVTAGEQAEAKRLVAYIVCDDESLTSASLQRTLKSQLPDYMIPAQWVFLPELPLSPNGKVDRRALPQPQDARPALQYDYTPPRCEMEATLAEIWAETIGVSQVGIHDNFFELGGDSLLSMQIISRAKTAGLRLTPRQMFACQTVAEQAAVATRETSPLADQGPVLGEAPLSPIQRWFFENDPADPHHFNQAVMVEVPQLSIARLEAAIEILHPQHDALRLRFEKTATGWRQHYAEPASVAPLHRFDLAGLPEEEQSAAIEREAARLQTCLNLQQGPLMQAALFELGPEKPCRLLFVVHHLAVDGVSWRILLEDLYATYQQLEQSQPPALPPKTTSYRQWTERLIELANSPEFEQQAKWWLSSLNKSTKPLPRDAEQPGVNLVGTTQDVRISFSQEETRAILSEVPRGLRCRMNDILLSALTSAVTNWTGEKTILCDLEGHGREDLFDDVDITRTVGWFTSQYPVSLSAGANLAETLNQVRGELRSIPRQGVGFGMLRYLSDSEELQRELAELPQPEITFNYLGQLDQTLGGGMLQLASESTGSSRAARQARRHAIEINGLVREGRLQFDWTFSKELHKEETIRRVAQSFAEQLRELIALARSNESGIARFQPPRDFLEHELAELWEKELDITPIGISDNFQSLGGTQIAAERIAAEIASRYELTLAAEEIRSQTTVETFAELIRKQAEELSPLLPIRAAEALARSPLFFVHPAGGNVFPYYGLTHRLDPRQSVYGLEARGLKGVLPPHDTIEAMAADYLRAVREIQPHGPYNLGGWSFGGLVAFEMAQQLIDAGEQVSLVSLLDTRLVSGEENQEEAAFAALTAMFPEAEPQTLAEIGMLDRETQLTHFMRQIEAAQMAPPGTGRDEARRMMEVFEANSRAWLAYRPRAARCPVHLFRAQEQDANHPVSEDLGWLKAGGNQLTIETVPGSHISMVREPHVRELTARLAAAFDGSAKL